MVVPRRWRLRFWLFLVRMWRRFALLRLNLTLASFLKRFAAPLLVFIFGITTPVFSLAPGAPCGRLWSPDNYFLIERRQSCAGSSYSRSSADVVPLDLTVLLATSSPRLRMPAPH